jgi:hypothetical protein
VGVGVGGYGGKVLHFLKIGRQAHTDRQTGWLKIRNNRYNIFLCDVSKFLLSMP